MISLPSNVKTELANKVGGKIVSFKMVSFPLGGGSTTFTFPDDFKGINGEPSTQLMGKYTVIFTYKSWERSDNDPRCAASVHSNSIVHVALGLSYLKFL